jgi:hypothetical protein
LLSLFNHRNGSILDKAEKLLIILIVNLMHSELEVEDYFSLEVELGSVEK